MCTQPLKILNPSRWLSPNSGQQLYLRVPCGHCLECRQRLQNEWRIRTYYECLDTINSGGYVLFDTLTYANQYLPRLSDYLYVPDGLDFPCFSSKHVQDFLKRLRSYLSRKHYENGKLIQEAYDIKDNLRFFVTSEYGHSEFGTKRPHYHIFLFVRNSCVPSLVLSRSISQCWPFGRTDGVPFKTRAYVREHNTFNTLDLATKRCLMYVSKYVAKDFIYSDMVVGRLKKLMDYYYGDDFGNCQWSKEQKEQYKQLKRFVLPFHRQSLEYGSSYIQAQGVDNIIQRGTLVFNVNGLPSTFALFPSLKRKLFYNRRKNDAGDVRWFLNNRGIFYKVLHFNDNVLQLQQKVNEYNIVHNEKLDFSVVDYLLNHDRLQSKRVGITDVQKQLVESLSVCETNGLRNYSSVDRDFLHKSVFTKLDYGSKKNGFHTLEKLRYVKHCDKLEYGDAISLADFERYMLYDENIEKQVEKLFDWLKTDGFMAIRTRKKLEKNKKILKHLNLC